MTRKYVLMNREGRHPLMPPKSLHDNLRSDLGIAPYDRLGVGRHPQMPPGICTVDSGSWLAPAARRGESWRAAPERGSR